MMTHAGLEEENGALRRQIAKLEEQLAVSEHDNTERKRTEAELRESETRFRSVLDNSQDVIFRLNVQANRFEYISPSVETVFGYTVADTLAADGSAHYQLIHPDDLPLVQSTIARLEMTGNGVVEYRERISSGEYRWFSSRVTLIKDKSGHPLYLDSITSDISERKHTEADLRASRDELSRKNLELAKANKLKDEFLQNMTHELRTPLNGILGLSEGLLGQYLGLLNENQTKALETVQSSGRRLLSAINDILDLTYIDAGKVQLDITQFDPQGTCKKSLASVKEQAQKKQIKISLTFDSSVERMTGDERRLHQMLVNLLDNAIKFTPIGGMVNLQIIGEAADDQVKFAVSDTGIGIAQHDMPLLFQPFVQLDGGLARRHEGTGVGLVLVERIAEMHGGGVSVESAVGKGSCFTITLPWAKEMRTNPVVQNPPTTIESQLPSALQADKNAPLILIAEDSETNMMMAAQYLSSQGYRLALARNGKEALEMAHAEHPAVILMDLQMPVMDGLEATRQLRQDSDSTLARTPIIALTALAMPQDRERALDAGATEYMSKPARLKQLGKLIEQLRTGH